MDGEPLNTTLSASGLAVAILTLLVTLMGALAALVLVAFICGLLLGVVITCYIVQDRKT